MPGCLAGWSGWLIWLIWLAGWVGWLLWLLAPSTGCWRVACSAGLSLGWVARKPGVTAVIAGARTPRQAVENAQSAVLLGKNTLWSVVDRVAALHGGI